MRTIRRWVETDLVCWAPQNLGMMKNIKAVLGPNPLLWCWPTVPPGDGLTFEIVQGNPVLLLLSHPDSYVHILLDGEYTGQWPPEDPATRMDETHVFTLPKDPWTYGNGSLNPDLYPGASNHGLRERRRSPASRQRHTNPHPGEGGEADEIYAVPPYHPDYDESQPSYGHLSQPPYADEDEDEEGRYCEDRPQRRQLIRRGSEGYEVRTIDREEMMRQYVESQSHLTAFARAQRRADEEGENYSVSDKEDGDDEGDSRVRDGEEIERDVRERLGEAGRYRQYVPERWESEGEEDEDVERIPNGLSVRG